MPTFSSAILPTTNGLTFGSSALRWSCFLQDIDVAGTPTFTGRVAIKNLEDIRFADQYTGTVSQQINAALADISSGLVVVPTSMGAGGFTIISAGKQVLDLRAGDFKIYNNNFTPAIQVMQDFVRTAVQSTSIVSGTAMGSFVAMSYSDSITRRDLANTTDLFIVSSDSATNQPIIGDTYGIQLLGPLKGAGALTGMTTGAFSGQITSSLATGTAPFSITSTTLVPNLNVATLNGVTVSGAPTTGQSLVATGTTTAAWSTAGGPKTESNQYTPVTISSIAAATTMMSFSLPANELSLGQSLKIVAHGTSTNGTGGAASNTFTATVGANTVYTSSTNAVPAGASEGWRMELLLTCTAAGSSGTIECSGWMLTISAVTTTSVSALTATIAMDTTSSNTIAIKGNCTVNSALMSITERQLLIERVG